MTEPKPDEIEVLRDRIRNCERDVSETDAESLLDFSTKIAEREAYGKYRHEKLLRHCTRIAEHVGNLSQAPTNREAAARIVQWIDDTYDNSNTNRDYRVALRTFAKYSVETDDIQTDDNGVPDAVSWVATRPSKSDDPLPDPEQFLELEADILPMINATRNLRDAALIGLQFETGLRSRELFNLTIGDLRNIDPEMLLNISGETGNRELLLVLDLVIDSLYFWTEGPSGHPTQSDYDAPLWSQLNKPQRISDQRFYQIFQDAADQAGVEKPVTPSNFRRSNLHWLARRNFPSSVIEYRQGRKQGSRTVAQYVSRYGRQTEAYANTELEEETVRQTDNEVVECPECEEQTPRSRYRCASCGLLLIYDKDELPGGLDIGKPVLSPGSYSKKPSGYSEKSNNTEQI